VKFGTFHLHSIPPTSNGSDVIAQQFEQMVLADAIGLDEVWLAEHNARRYGMVSNALTVAAAVAAATRRIRVATAVTRLPLHHPLQVAEDIGYVDVLSGGRFDWGIGKGYDPLEFSTYGVPFEDREDRWQANFEAVLGFWETRRTALKNDYYELADAELVPTPLQRPTPPIYIMVSRSDSSVTWAAQRLYPIVLGQGPDWEDVRQKVDLYRKTAHAAGHDRADVEEVVRQFWQVKQVHVSLTTERAYAEYKDALMWYFEMQHNRLMFGFAAEPKPYEWYLEHRSVLLGSSDKVANDIGDYRDYTGVNNLILWFNCGHQPHPQVVSSMYRFAEDVRPQLER